MITFIVRQPPGSAGIIFERHCAYSVAARSQNENMITLPDFQFRCLSFEEFSINVRDNFAAVIKQTGFFKI